MTTNPFEGLARPIVNRPGDPAGVIVDVRMSYAQAMAIKQKVLDGQPVDADARAMADRVVRETRTRMTGIGTPPACKNCSAVDVELNSYQVCAVCQAETRARNKAARQSIMAQARALNDGTPPAERMLKCRDCDAEPMHGGKRCEVHWAADLESKRAARTERQQADLAAAAAWEAAAGVPTPGKRTRRRESTRMLLEQVNQLVAARNRLQAELTAAQETVLRYRALTRDLTRRLQIELAGQL